jgi:hypothetical protein
MSKYRGKPHKEDQNHKAAQPASIDEPNTAAIVAPALGVRMRGRPLRTLHGSPFPVNTERAFHKHTTGT